MEARKLIFLHGFFASGACVPAQALKECMAGKALVLTPDLPLHPQEALAFIRRLCEQEHPDLLVGNSNGAFLAQIVASENGLPALLGNPYFEMTRFLAERLGPHEYKSPRADGRAHFVIDQALIDEFAEVQRHQWDHCTPEGANASGAFSGRTTVWRTTSRSSSRTTPMPSTFPDSIHPRRKRCGRIMCRSLRSCGKPSHRPVSENKKTGRSPFGYIPPAFFRI